MYTVNCTVYIVHLYVYYTMYSVLKSNNSLKITLNCILYVQLFKIILESNNYICIIYYLDIVLTNKLYNYYS